MRSPLGTLLNKTPISYAPRGYGRAFASMFSRNDVAAQLEAMGSVGTLFSIVNLTSNATSQIEWTLYRKSESGKPEERTPVTEHAALMVWHKPNPFMVRQEFVEVEQQHVDLTGEGWWVVARDPRFTIPLELWPVRPDRIYPVPHPTEFLSGYVYCGPDGEKVPLNVDEVIQLRMPNPMDPYRGMGPVQSLLADLDSVRYSAEWNRRFFINDATPGGVIEVPEQLSDDEFKTLMARWKETHQGLGGAHRVAILENAKFTQASYSMRDMQFVQLREVSREIIREAFGIHGHLLGLAADINRANAEAAEVVFGRWKLVPRLERFKQALNNDFLPMFGVTAEGLEFDYANPVPEDAEAEDRERTSKTAAFKTLVDAGVDPEDAAMVVGLPTMRMRGSSEQAS